MKFGGALQMLEMGVPMTRSSWGCTDEQIFLDGEIFMRTKDGKTFPTIFFSHEILATDWEVVRTRGGS